MAKMCTELAAGLEQTTLTSVFTGLAPEDFSAVKSALALVDRLIKQSFDEDAAADVPSHKKPKTVVRCALCVCLCVCCF